jgi:2',3'-cyclic-nucleotide 2'-phosphodiesterase (5'-nucleotidase family)
VDTAIYRGLYDAMGEVTRLMGPPSTSHNGSPPAPNDVADRPKGQLLTLWFTGNVHGEREDCGCKHHPRGGLARKATLIQQGANPSRELDRPDAQLILDAGNLLFPGPHVAQLADAPRKAKLLEAEAVVESFNLIGCDAFLVGALDLAMGLEPLLALKQRARFPWISANLHRKGEAATLFPPFVVTEKMGKKILVVGVTSASSQDLAALQAAGLEITDPKAALLSQREAIAAQKPDLVILLSNLGMDATVALGAEQDVRALPVHVALVSGSSRQTYQPVFSQSVPVLEADQRGKFLGRLDVHIVDHEVVFAPEEPKGLAQVREYMDSYRSVFHARRSVFQVRDAPEADPRAQQIRRNLPLALERLAQVERGLPGSVQLHQAPASKSWLLTQMIPVELDLAQDPKVRKLLDGYIKKTAPLLPAPPKPPKK